MKTNLVICNNCETEWDDWIDDGEVTCAICNSTDVTTAKISDEDNEDNEDNDD